MTIVNREPIPQDEYEKACVVVRPSRLLFIHLLLLVYCVCALNAYSQLCSVGKARNKKNREAGQVGPTYTEKEK